MSPVVHAEVLELLQRAAAEHLAQEEEEPVDLVLLVGDLRPHGALVPARVAVRQRRELPSPGRAVVHGVTVGDDVVAQLPELGLQVVGDGLPGAAALAPRLALDGRDAPAQQALQRAVLRGPLSRPWERRLDEVGGGVGAADGAVGAAVDGARSNRRRRRWSSASRSVDGFRTIVEAVAGGARSNRRRR